MILFFNFEDFNCDHGDGRVCNKFCSARAANPEVLPNACEEPYATCFRLCTSGSTRLKK